MSKTLIFTVTTDLSYDQRMIRICNSLSMTGYRVLLVGRKLRSSIPIILQPFQQKRIRCVFEKGILFYIEFNIRLFLYLLFKRMDGICAIDLDTILPVYLISRLKKAKRVYDAHELFCEMKEIVTRPRIYAFWKRIERFSVPKFSNGYTVNQPISEEFKKMYGVDYEIIRNIAVLRQLEPADKPEKFILYQGAINEGRSFETLIPAFKEVNAPLFICGDGNFLDKAKDAVVSHHLQNKVIFKGKIAPDQLRLLTAQAYIGITLFENKGLSNYYSLGNRFFDYLHAGVPQLCVNYPVYRQLNDPMPVAVLIDDLSSENIALHLNNLLENEVLYEELCQNCLTLRQKLNWQAEEKTLIHFYSKLFE